MHQACGYPDQGEVLDSPVPKPMNTKNTCDMHGSRLVRLSCRCRTPTQIRAPKRRANKVSYESKSCHLSHRSPGRNQIPGLWSWPQNNPRYTLGESRNHTHFSQSLSGLHLYFEFGGCTWMHRDAKICQEHQFAHFEGCIYFITVYIYTDYLDIMHLCYIVYQRIVEFTFQWYQHR